MNIRAPKEKRICIICRKEFQPTNSRNSTCSKKCSKIHKKKLTKRWIQEQDYQKKWLLKHPDYQKLRQTNHCIDCGKSIWDKALRCGACSHKGKLHYNYGKKPEEKLGFKSGKDNPCWKGNNVGYEALHEWIKKRKPKPKLCERCKKRPPYDLANISGEYRRDVNDFEWICRKCHMKDDGRINNLKQYGGK